VEGEVAVIKIEAENKKNKYYFRLKVQGEG
jgi:hypothetical protein